MGDAADWAIECALADWDTDDDFFDLDPFNPDSHTYRARRRRSKTCNTCGAYGLRWDIDEETDKYYLSERDGRRHVCKFKGFMKSV